MLITMQYSKRFLLVAKVWLMVVVAMTTIAGPPSLLAMHYQPSQEDIQKLVGLIADNQRILLDSFQDLQANSHSSEFLFNTIESLVQDYGVNLTVIVLKKWLEISGKSLCTIIDQDGNTILHFATGELFSGQSIIDQLNCLEVILAVADVDLLLAKDNDGWTGLLRAACYGREEIVSMLLAATDAFNRTQDLLFMADCVGLTALHLAARMGRAGVAGILLTAADKFGRAKELSCVLSCDTTIMNMATSMDIKNITALDYARNELVQYKKYLEHLNTLDNILVDGRDGVQMRFKIVGATLLSSRLMEDFEKVIKLLEEFPYKQDNKMHLLSSYLSR